MQHQSYPLNTIKFAERNLITQQTVRKQLCINGSFYGVKPLKLATGRLAWPDVVVTKEGV